MPIATPTTLGQTAGTTNGTSFTHSTSATVTGTADTVMFAIAYAVSSTSTIPTLSMSGGVTWTKDKEVTGTAGGLGWATAVFSGPAASTVNSATTLTLSTVTTCLDGLIAACYSTGLDQTSSRTDGSDGRFRTVSINTTWDSQGGTAPTTTNPNTLIIGGASVDGTLTSTVSSPIFELSDFSDATDAQSLNMDYKILSATGAVRLTGTWSGTPGGVQDTGIAVAYKAAASGVNSPTFEQVPFFNTPYIFHL